MSSRGYTLRTRRPDPMQAFIVVRSTVLSTGPRGFRLFRRAIYSRNRDRGPRFASVGENALGACNETFQHGALGLKRDRLAR